MADRTDDAAWFAGQLSDVSARGIANQTATLIRSLAGRHAFMVIDHDMDFVEQLAAPVSVLHMGRLIAHGTVDDVPRDPRVAAVYLGRENEEHHARA